MEQVLSPIFNGFPEIKDLILHNTSQNKIKTF